MVNLSKDKYYGFFVNPLHDTLFAIAALGQDGTTSEDIDWARTREEADAKRLSYMAIAAAMKFPGTYNGILGSMLTWLETANGKRMDAIAAENLATVLDVTFEVERLVVEAGLKWEKTIARADVHQIAARLISDNVAIGSKNVSAETIARAAFEYATTPNDKLPDGCADFIVARVESKFFEVREGALLQTFFQAVRDAAEAKYGDADLASDEGAILYDFGREMSYIQRLDPELLAAAASETARRQAFKAGVVDPEVALPAA